MGKVKYDLEDILIMDFEGTTRLDLTSKQFDDLSESMEVTVEMTPLGIPKHHFEDGSVARVGGVKIFIKGE